MKIFSHTTAKLLHLTYRIGTHTPLYSLIVNCGSVDTTPSNPSTPKMPDMPSDGKNWVLDVPPELPQWQSQPMTTSESVLSSGKQSL